MGDKTGIQWTDATVSGSVLQLMTRFAKRQAVAHFEAKFWMVGKPQTINFWWGCTKVGPGCARIWATLPPSSKVSSRSGHEARSRQRHARRPPQIPRRQAPVGLGWTFGQCLKTSWAAARLARDSGSAKFMKRAA